MPAPAAITGIAPAHMVNVDGQANFSEPGDNDLYTVPENKYLVITDAIFETSGRRITLELNEMIGEKTNLKIQRELFSRENIPGRMGLVFQPGAKVVLKCLDTWGEHVIPFHMEGYLASP